MLGSKALDYQYKRPLVFAEIHLLRCINYLEVVYPLITDLNKFALIQQQNDKPFILEPTFENIHLKRNVVMGPFVASLRYWTETGGREQVAPLVVLKAASENEAVQEAAALADSYYPGTATELVVRIFGNEPHGHPIGEIYRPRSI